MQGIGGKNWYEAKFLSLEKILIGRQDIPPKRGRSRDTQGPGSETDDILRPELIESKDLSSMMDFSQ